MKDNTVNCVNKTSKTGIKSVATDGLEKLYVVFSSQKKLIVFIAIWSVILNYFLEVSLRKNILLGFMHIVGQPITFLYNSLIVFATFSLIFLFKRRLFYFTVASVVWLSLGITNYIVLLSRNTPLNAPDFRIIKSAVGVVTIYLNIFEQILVVFLILLAITLLTLAFVKGRKSQRNMYFSCSAVGMIASVTLALTMFVSNGVTASHFSDLPTAYKEYGFAFSFLCSVFDRGIDKPEIYDDESVQTLKNQLEDNIIEDEIDDINNVDVNTDTESDNTVGVQGTTEERPNVIFLQLESFYDITNVEGLTFNEDPIPIFRSLMNNYTSGKFTVPSIGAGTANTEFEAITGMDIDYFGVAEYPYLSVLQENTCESMAYNLREYGYMSHAVHNHSGSFYDRHLVFQNLGFDTFTSIENMHRIVRNETGWAKDSMLTNELYDLINSTDKQDFVYAISVQGHGKYPADKDVFDTIYNENHPAHIVVTGNEENEQKYGIDYWVNQIHDMDIFVGSLINRFASFSEPTVIVMYGDHLPAFDLDTWKLKEGNLYQTQYVVWNNYGKDFGEDTDLNSYEISSFVMKKLGYDAGYINRLHQEYSESDADYSEELHLLQYDVLYGDKKIFEGNNRYVPSNIKYGYKKVNINYVSELENSIFVYGEGLNEYSVIYVNGSKKTTSFINDGCVAANNIDLKAGDVIKIVQTTDDLVGIGESNYYEINAN